MSAWGYFLDANSQILCMFDMTSIVMKTLGTHHVAGKDKHFVWQTELVSLVKISIREKRKEDRERLQLVNFEAVKTKHLPKQHRHYAALHQGPLATDCHGAAHRCYWELKMGKDRCLW